MKFARFLILAFLVVSLISCVTVNPNSRQPKKIEGQSGRLLPFYSISIAADYDPRLDGVIQGYKLLPVMIRNLSLRPVSLDVENDRWIVVGEKGHKYKAVNSLRVKDPVMSREMPDKIRSMIDYPEVVPINYSVTFDLLLPPHSNLQYFREIRYYNADWGKEFVIKKEY